MFNSCTRFRADLSGLQIRAGALTLAMFLGDPKVLAGPRGLFFVNTARATTVQLFH